MDVAGPAGLPVRAGVWDPTRAPHTDETGAHNLYGYEQVLRVLTDGEAFSAGPNQAKSAPPGGGRLPRSACPLPAPERRVGRCETLLLAAARPFGQVAMTHGTASRCMAAPRSLAGRTDTAAKPSVPTAAPILPAATCWR
jgi:hypothetical protein